MLCGFWPKDSTFWVLTTYRSTTTRRITKASLSICRNNTLCELNIFDTTTRMANWLSAVLLLLGFSFTLTSGRSLHFSQEAIQGSDEPDPDAEFSFVLLETTSVKSHYEKLPFLAMVSSNAEDTLAAYVSLDPDNDFEEPKLTSNFEESSIASILNQNGLPIGLLPSSIESYTLRDDGLFSVSLSKECYVDFDYEVYYGQTITGKLSYGAISDVSGIQAKKGFLWLSVSGMHTDDSSSSYVYFDVGPISKKLPISQFESVPVCKTKAINLSAFA